MSYKGFTAGFGKVAAEWPKQKQERRQNTIDELYKRAQIAEAGYDVVQDPRGGYSISQTQGVMPYKQMQSRKMQMEMDLMDRYNKMLDQQMQQKSSASSERQALVDQLNQLKAMLQASGEEETEKEEENEYGIPDPAGVLR